MLYSLASLAPGEPPALLLDPNTLSDDGTVALRGQPQFDRARNLTEPVNTYYNGLSSRRPLLVVQAMSEADVQAAVAFARAHGLPICARAGGHAPARPSHFLSHLSPHPSPPRPRPTAAIGSATKRSAAAVQKEGAEAGQVSRDRENGVGKRGGHPPSGQAGRRKRPTIFF